MTETVTKCIVRRLIAVGSLALLVGAVANRSARAQTCQEMKSNVKDRVSAYISKQNGLPIGSTLTLKKADILPGSCVRKLTYSVNWPKKSISVFLSADQRYFSTAVFDLTTDPVIVTNKAVAKTEEVGALREPSEKMIEIEKNAASRGPQDAPVTIVEFSDFECPFCGRMTALLSGEILPKEGQSVRLIFKQFPLSIHPWAQDAAEISECARKQDENAFWELHDFFFSHQQSLRKENLRSEVGRFFASEPKIKLDRLNACVDSHETRAKVLSDIKEGENLGIHGTPTLFVNGTRSVGLKTAAAMEAMIEAARGGSHGQPN
jgi:protein-disulfide isomerase